MDRTARPAQPSKGPPEWLLHPAAGWAYLVLVIVLAVTPALPVVIALAAVGAVVVYLERTASGYPAFWWTVGAFFIGPIVYLFFIYKRPKDAVVYAPDEAIRQQARMVRGLPPKAPAHRAGAPADWYPDPLGDARLRYWDGSAWTDHTAN